ncbi:uncharacterized protein SPSK_05754 [Sporothrix schenckii 1099-18]|uniref:Uncharacterized protein n=1 Tax=Sporothrix schenckii 1099-18 TaxID=1397361 RepID=A0A0F2LU07_SPOSC|nr:uncharacterized protein SPSK_05754 [Sporothrix schenckii 1099-18]KJR80948.1 hypothetical protein SPSK_05754 [Sporothrix schenckii 1099-18]
MGAVYMPLSDMGCWSTINMRHNQMSPYAAPANDVSTNVYALSYRELPSGIAPLEMARPRTNERKARPQRNANKDSLWSKTL